MDRPLPAARAARRGRHGDGLAGAAGRAGAAQGRRQGDQGGHGYAAGGGPVRIGAASARPDEPPGHRQGLRRRQHAGGAAVLRHGVRGRREPHRALRPRAARARAAAGVARGGLRGRPARAPEGGDPPRPEAVEHPGGGRRRKGAAEDHRLRHRQGGGAAAQRAHPADRGGRGDRHARIHEPRAGRSDRGRRRYPHRRLFARRDSLRAAHGGASAELARAAHLEPGGAAAQAARGGSAAPERAGEQPGCHPRGGAQPQHRPGKAPPPAAGRSRRDHDEGAGEGPRAPIRNALGAGGRSRAISAQRAGAGAAAERGISGAQIYPAQSRAGRWRRGGVRRADGGRGGEHSSVAAGAACRAQGRVRGGGGHGDERIPPAGPPRAGRRRAAGRQAGPRHQGPDRARPRGCEDRRQVRRAARGGDVDPRHHRRGLPGARPLPGGPAPPRSGARGGPFIAGPRAPGDPVGGGESCGPL